MNKPDRFTTAYITFFDIESKEVLWTTKTKGLPGSKWGYKYYWFEGYVECLKVFMSKYY
ncbi:MAG: hypothetical protein HC819_01985 [Cyclobacteriaceae bacterium]|nr:hypothetical protein [Cyclobacteriaceae bacterium]